MESLIRRLEQWSMIIAGVCVIAMMLAVCIDAAARYLLRAPLPWTFDLVSYYLMVGAAYFALSSTYRHGDHVNIPMLYSRLPLRARAWVEVVTSVLAAVLFALVAHTGWESMIEAWAHGEFNPGFVRWPVWLSILPIPLGSALLVLRLLDHSLTLATRGEDSSVLPDDEAEIGE
ncbi:MAG: TRAP transporter small permease [Burkholderiales bacterium]|nr:TRAP transporter small permease [Burkholderiales bacterium]